MDEQALLRLRTGAADCPSNLDLDELHTDELPAEAAARVREHLAGCALCQERMAQRQLGFASAPDLDPQSLLADIKQGARAAQVVQLRRRWVRRAAVVFTPLAAAAALLIVLIGKQPENTDSPGLREKGGLALYVYKVDGNRALQAVSGDRFREGDRLRFLVDLPTAGHVNMLGLEASGQLYVAWPNREGVSTLRSAGKRQELPGTSALDSSHGREVLYLVECPAAVGPPSAVCRADKLASASAAPSCPSACALTPFVLNKE